jgi:hypothetical protein
MIKTLRITSIVAVVLTVAFFAFPAVFGARGDEQTEQFIDIRAKFEKVRGQRSARGRSQVSPLVVQAQKFAAYIDPPKPPKLPITTPGTRPPLIVAPPPPRVSTKFTLIGTSYYASHPELSLALIDEPGKGMYWVRQSGKVGHLIIEQVKDGLIVVRDGERTSELVPQRPVKISLLKGKGVSSGRPGPRATLPASIGPKATSTVPTKATASTVSSRHPSSRPPQMSAERRMALEKLVSELKAGQAGAGSDKADSKRSAEEAAALMGKLISDLQATRISAEEAKRLDLLGKELKDITEDPNRPRSRKIERPQRSQEPSSPPKK